MSVWRTKHNLDGWSEGNEMSFFFFCLCWVFIEVCRLSYYGGAQVVVLGLLTVAISFRAKHELQGMQAQ